MASLMEELLEVLGEEESRYQTLAKLGEEKRQAIVKADIAALDAVTVKEQDVSSELLNISHRRTSVLKDIATVLGKDPRELTLTKLIGYLDKQPVEQERLREQRDRLLKTGGKMQSLNQQNEELLQRALEMVEFDLTLLRSMKQVPETANYDRSANNTGDLLGTSGFDAKQ